MAKMQEFKCPCCGGSIEFDSSVQKMKCPFCDTEFDVGTLSEYAQTVEEEQPEDMSWSDEAGSEWRDGESEGLRTYVCKSCGGEIVGDANTAATACPFCGSPVVMTGQLSGALKPDAGILRNHTGIASDRIPECIFRTVTDTLIGTFLTLAGRHIIFICKISSQIRSLKIHRFFEIKRLYRLHQIIFHAGRAIHRYMIKTKRTTSMYCIIAGLRIIIITIAPEPGLCCTVTDICVCVCVIQPERNVDALNLADMIL